MSQQTKEYDTVDNKSPLARLACGITGIHSIGESVDSLCRDETNAPMA